ncbi:CinA family protein [Agromyces aurantiacus]|uniref:CinA family protein n=1 Tax=Agromyces aurantiacus TaxID=165814 RepID=A0ABV9R196_9MICO|nr:nicotinamide-nucleotide amidohydrolase family protein [Agromyces aurantiacus]MBM7502569.1 nicotinamide-nucleotide amidase [Agromyces aurantiacus]
MAADDDLHSLADEIGRMARARGLAVATAESLTSGAIASGLGRGEGASEWFAGGVVAYAERVKRDVLGVTATSVLTAQCARELATGVARLLDADVAVAVTGVGGPDAEEGLPPGTVYAALRVGDEVTDATWRFEGDPSSVVEQTVRAAIGLVRAALG